MRGVRALPISRPLRGSRLVLLGVVLAVAAMHTSASAPENPAAVGHDTMMVVAAPGATTVPEHPIAPGSAPHEEHIESLCQSTLPTVFSLTLLLPLLSWVPLSARFEQHFAHVRGQWRAREPPDLASLCVLRV